MADANLIKSQNLAKVSEVDFVEQFSESIKKLVEALGITRKIPKVAGTVLKTYKATGTLQDGTVAEGNDIPLSQYITEAVTYKEIALSKWAKATSVEAITEKGYEQAVGMTTDRMLKDVQKGIRKDFFDFLATGNTAVNATTLQGVLAKAWGQLQVLFEDDEISAVYFVNPLDVADYLATANITTQSAFGMTYVENFLGLGTLIMNSSVPSGKIYATAKDNIVLYYIPVNGTDVGEAFDFTSDATGLIGIHEVANYDNLTFKDVVLCGMALFAERIDGVVMGKIGSSADAVTYTEDELNQMTLSKIKEIASSLSYTTVASETTKAGAIAKFLVEQG